MKGKIFSSILYSVSGIRAIRTGFQSLQEVLRPVPPVTELERKADEELADRVKGQPLYPGEPEYMQSFRYTEIRHGTENDRAMEKALKPMLAFFALCYFGFGFGLIALWSFLIYHFLVTPFL